MSNLSHRALVLAAAVLLPCTLAGTPLHAQTGGRNWDGVPPGHRPPPGLCRIWLDGVPPGRQPRPTSCAWALTHVPRNGRVLVGSNVRLRYDQLPRRFDPYNVGALMWHDMLGQWVGWPNQLDRGLYFYNYDLGRYRYGRGYDTRYRNDGRYRDDHRRVDPRRDDRDHAKRVVPTPPRPPKPPKSSKPHDARGQDGRYYDSRARDAHERGPRERGASKHDGQRGHGKP